MFPLFMFLAFSVSTTAGPAPADPRPDRHHHPVLRVLDRAGIHPHRTQDQDVRPVLSAPVSLNSVVMGESMSGFLYSIGIAFVPLIAGISSSEHR